MTTGMRFVDWITVHIFNGRNVSVLQSVLVSSCRLLFIAQFYPYFSLISANALS
jgi:hypothetical protein